MTSSSPSPADTLREETAATQRLLEILKREQAQLLQADIEGLTQLTEEKAGILVQMSSLAMHRHQALASAGFEPKESGMQAWVDGHRTEQQAWTELLSLARSAKEMNRTNGLLINKHIARNQTAISVLQNATSPGGSIYGPDGQSSIKSSPRGVIVG